ncbi:hypothetical protein [Actinomadura madurae]|uniref:hypothetical protein n=1 Tax=Actinomadura madurae TaxID=1993 RepID=UPI0020D215D1|nr:hypothetical protein [Actinomadura madurae]MCQ0005885.1 hypothetical protein [Actinomadura madurae]
MPPPGSVPSSRAREVSVATPSRPEGSRPGARVQDEPDRGEPPAGQVAAQRRRPGRDAARGPGREGPGRDGPRDGAGLQDETAAHEVPP